MRTVNFPPPMVTLWNATPSMPYLHSAVSRCVGIQHPAQHQKLQCIRCVYTWRDGWAGGDTLCTGAHMCVRVCAPMCLCARVGKGLWFDVLGRMAHDGHRVEFPPLPDDVGNGEIGHMGKADRYAEDDLLLLVPDVGVASTRTTAPNTNKFAI